jgi:hypothetical protein
MLEEQIYGVVAVSEGWKRRGTFFVTSAAAERSFRASLVGFARQTALCLQGSVPIMIRIALCGFCNGAEASNNLPSSSGQQCK